MCTQMWPSQGLKSTWAACTGGDKRPSVRGWRERGCSFCWPTGRRGRRPEGRRLPTTQSRAPPSAQRPTRARWPFSAPPVALPAWPVGGKATGRAGSGRHAPAYLLGPQERRIDGLHPLRHGVAHQAEAVVVLRHRPLQPFPRPPGHQLQERGAHLVQRVQQGFVALSFLLQLLGTQAERHRPGGHATAGGASLPSALGARALHRHQAAWAPWPQSSSIHHRGNRFLQSSGNPLVNMARFELWNVISAFKNWEPKPSRLIWIILCLLVASK